MVSLPELTDMLLLPLPPPAAFVAVVLAVGRLRRVPSASFKEYVPLGDRAFFLSRGNDEGDFDLPPPPRFGERLGEISPNGERVGDRLGDRRFDLVPGGGLFLGERLLDDLPRMGERLLPLDVLLSPTPSLVLLSTTLFANEFSNDVRMGLQLSPSMSVPSPETSIPLDDEEEMCEMLRELVRRPPPAPAPEVPPPPDATAILLEGRERRALTLLLLLLADRVPRLLLT